MDPGGVISEICLSVTLNVGFMWPLIVGELFSGMFTERAQFNREKYLPSGSILTGIL